MATLLFRSAGVMQSWGIDSRFDVRDTGVAPSRSGILGLVCSALGRARSESLEDLASLRMGVRVDFPGTVRRDFQTAADVVTADGKLRRGTAVTSNRYYLADADFLVALEGELDLLSRINEAVKKPVWMLFLGRKGYPPSVPVWIPDGLREKDNLEEALRRYPWPGIMCRKTPEPEKRPETLRLVVETEHGEMTRPDWPLSFAARDFALRRVTTEYIKLEEIPLRGIH